MQNNIDISIKQVTSDSSVTFFHIPLPIELKGETGDTIVVADPVFSGEIFSFNPGFKVEQVILDPDLWIISKNNQVIEKEDALAEQIEVFPNPGNQVFTIIAKKPELFARSLQVVDRLGKEIISITYSENIPKHTIDLFGKSSGVYFFKIETASGIVEKKVIYEK